MREDRPEVSVLARALIVAKGEAEALDESLKAKKEEVGYLERELWNAMVDGGLDKVTVDGVSYRPEIKVHGSIDKEYGEDTAFAALREHGFGGLIKETVHPGTFGAFVREQIEGNDGENLPGWLAAFVKVYREHRIATRRGAK